MSIERISGATDQATLGLRRRDDEFSAQFASAHDPRFWVRVERPFEAPLSLSDFLPGRMNEVDQAAALAFILRDLDLPRCEALAFQALRDKADVERIARVMEIYVSRERRFITGKRLEEGRRKALHIDLR